MILIYDVVVRTCEDPNKVDISNGKPDNVMDLSYLSKVKVTCDVGYVANHNQHYIMTCSEAGLWDSHKYTCTGK